MVIGTLFPSSTLPNTLLEKISVNMIFRMHLTNNPSDTCSFIHCNILYYSVFCLGGGILIVYTVVYGILTIFSKMKLKYRRIPKIP